MYVYRIYIEQFLSMRCHLLLKECAAGDLGITQLESPLFRCNCNDVYLFCYCLYVIAIFSDDSLVIGYFN